MSKKVKIQGQQVAFPPACVVCASPSEKTFEVQRMFTYGKRNITITLPVPMCSQHFDMAKTKSPVEKLVEKLGLFTGLVIGLLAAIGLLVYWAGSGQGNLFLNIFMGLIAGAGFGLIIWAVSAFWLAPLFATPAAKTARRAVKLTRFWPRDDVLELEFANEQMAAGFTRENAAHLAG